MEGWGEFILAFIAFLTSHSIPTRPRVRAILAARLGQRGFTLAYSILSLALLYWLIKAVGRAPYVPLWAEHPWHRYVTFAGVFGAIEIAALSIGRPNPLSFGGTGNDRFDPQMPGIIGWTRHPLLLALFLWSAAHIPANGDLAHLILFGTFAAFAALGMTLIDRRKQRQMGRERWLHLSTTTRRLTVGRQGILRFSAGLAAFGALYLLHGPIIGIQPTF